MTPSPLRLFHPQFADHIDASTQVDRMPGVDAPCLCPLTGVAWADGVCMWPYCDWKRDVVSSPAVSSHESEETP